MGLIPSFYSLFHIFFYPSLYFCKQTVAKPGDFTGPALRAWATLFWIVEDPYLEAELAVPFKGCLSADFRERFIIKGLNGH